MTPSLYDLFGEIPVSQEEIEIWIDVVPGWPRTSHRRAYYARNWNVAEKIRQAKMTGFWEDVQRARSDQLDQIGATTSGRRQ